MSEHPLNIAVVGGGVSGIVAAWLLSRRHQVTLFEKEPLLGGHTHTVTLPDGPDAGLGVDMGFIVFNDRTYPLFNLFLDQLGVGRKPTTMSFSYSDAGRGLHYSGTLRGLFGNPRNLGNPAYWRMLAAILRFGRGAEDDLRAGRLADLTLGSYLELRGCPVELVRDYLTPMAAAIWSAPRSLVLEYPAEAFVTFFANHGLLSLTRRPQWYVIPGGSSSYVRAFEARFGGAVRTAAPVRGVARDPEGGVRVRLDSGEEVFDTLVMACHADQTLRLLDDADRKEQRLLGAWRYNANDCVLHTDTSLLPPERRHWSAWNALHGPSVTDDAPVFVSYAMNILQRFEAARDYVVTLNAPEARRPEQPIQRQAWEHPLYDVASLASQRRLPELNGRRNTWFCGSYFGYGFHEDGVRSAVRVAADFGIAL